MRTPALLCWATALLAAAVTQASALETVIRYPAPEQRHLNTVTWTARNTSPPATSARPSLRRMA